MNGGRILSSMAFLRVMSGLIEIFAAILILKLGKITHALQINAALGLIGPVVFLLISALGVVTVAVNLSPWKISAIIAGATLILWGTT